MSDRKLQYYAKKEDEGHLVKEYLKSKFHLSVKEISHAKGFDDGITVNGMHVNVKYKLKENDLLEVVLHEKHILVPKIGKPDGDLTESHVKLLAELHVFSVFQLFVGIRKHLFYFFFGNDGRVRGCRRTDIRIRTCAFLIDGNEHAVGTERIFLLVYDHTRCLPRGNGARGNRMKIFHQRIFHSRNRGRRFFPDLRKCFFRQFFASSFTHDDSFPGSRLRLVYHYLADYTAAPRNL